MKRTLRLAALLVFCVLTFAARCHNLRDVFIDGRIYFVDPDCYSRMTRARMVAGHPGMIVRHHGFENYPQGVESHTTAPLDYLIVAGKKAIDAGFGLFDSGRTSVLRDQSLDLAGAFIAPLLGVLGAVFLAVWAWALRLRFWGMALLLYAVCPILVHGTLLGRPDHQSLLIVLLMVALGAEIALARRRAEPFPNCHPERSEAESKDLSHPAGGGGGESGAVVPTTSAHEKLEVVASPPPPARLSRRASARLRPQSRAPLRMTGWGIAAGVAWALSLWVSLYEPLILLGAVLALWLAFDRRALLAPERRAGWITFAAILAVAFFLEGWRIAAPDAAMREDFGRWKASVGELAHLDLRSPEIFRWLGWMILAAPVLLLLRRKSDRRGLPLLLLLIVALGLTVWQLRWGYFLAAVFVLALPIFMPAWRRVWVARLAFVIALWPVAQEWDAMLPGEPKEAARAGKRAEVAQLRRLAAQMRGETTAPFLAPWWLSPALAYWSGQPGVAGSSHEALPGTMETARFFLAPGPDKAEAIARRLGVRYVLTDGPDADGDSRLVKAYAPLLDGKVPPEPWGVRMHERGRPRERMTAEELRDTPPELRAGLIESAARAEAAELGSRAFSCVAQEPFFKLFVVQDSPHAP